MAGEAIRLARRAEAGLKEGSSPYPVSQPAGSGFWRSAGRGEMAYNRFRETPILCSREKRLDYSHE